MSWLFSQALVAEYSAATCWNGAPSAPLNVMPAPHRLWRNDKTMDCSRLSQFGLTCAVLTDDHGEALLTWFREGSLAKTSRRQAKVWASQEPAPDCGGRWHELPMRYDRATSTRWGVIGAADFGAPHQRDRIWLIAEDTHQAMANASGEHGKEILPCRIDAQIRGLSLERSPGSRRHGVGSWSSEPGMGRVADGLAHRMDRLKAIGNGQVPVVAASAFNSLYDRR
ncbi:hypothetical protein SAMN05660489_04959 [Pseudomonas sp. LAMO17WK12:I10]|nr:hypothetical protein H160_04931 [Pseudomonas sp. LAMO17WK12:I9]SNY48712.1 hypothetical protein SAMN05660489_04959 [Pseudomonas sp. LAMO17WK12:I10]